MEICFSHQPVMLKEVITGLNINPQGTYVDCTLGGGGHSEKILAALTTGRLIAIDKDTDALTYAKDRLGEDKITYLHDDFKQALPDLPLVDGILMDLGISSYQIDTAERGFSYRFDAPLDMRMDKDSPLTARDVINKYSEKELADVIFKYGEEQFSRRIARNVVEARRVKPIETTTELVSLIEKSVPAKVRWKGGHPAKKTFQAIRIEVNGELTGLYEAVVTAVSKLKTGGRLCIIAFHSLEDRIIKQAMKYLELDCICDKQSLICTCNKVSEIKVLTKKPITASPEELARNSRAECAKLRIAEKK